MFGHPEVRLNNILAGKVASDDINVARCILGLDIGKQSDVGG